MFNNKIQKAAFTQMMNVISLISPECSRFMEEKFPAHWEKLSPEEQAAQLEAPVKELFTDICTENTVKAAADQRTFNAFLPAVRYFAPGDDREFVDMIGEKLLALTEEIENERRAVRSTYSEAGEKILRKIMEDAASMSDKCKQFLEEKSAALENLSNEERFRKLDHTLKEFFKDLCTENTLQVPSTEYTAGICLATADYYMWRCDKELPILLSRKYDAIAEEAKK